jgi:DNA helicase HerA-like ATPase
MQILAEGFAAAGVPVFLADIKGDLGGMAEPGDPAGRLHEAFRKRAATIGFELSYRGFPVTFWDVFGEQGHPVRTTVAEMGPLLLSRLLELSEAQEGALNIAFRLADEEGLPLLDLRDLRALLAWLGENAGRITLEWGNVAPATVGAIQRRLLVLENQGAARLFGEPALALADLMRVEPDGTGRISILAADRLMGAPRLYATFLLWLLSELFEELPEVGDPDKPRLVFFFDEAHLLFADAPKALVEKVEQVARLIRSKGVGIYFVTQNPADVPDAVLAQLGNRVQHALRAFTPRDQADLRKAAQTYRPNPRFSTEAAIREVGTGEAVTSFLDAKGAPGVVERTLIRPPASRLGPIEPEARARLIAASPLAGRYEAGIDRESAHEILAARAAAAAAAAERQAGAGGPDDGREFRHARRYDGGAGGASADDGRSPAAGSRRRAEPSLGEAFGRALVKELSGTTGRRLVRGILGGLLRQR